MPYVAKRMLRFGDRDIQPGEIVPEDPHRRYESLLAMGWIERVPEQPKQEPPPQEEPKPDPEPQFVCEECGQKFPSEHGLKVHITRRHWRP